MSVHHATARKLATQAEWTLLEASRAREITELTPARLTQKIARARKLRDKYRDLAKQQRGEARGKRNAKSTRAAEGNANTLIKQQMFAEALERFEERLEKVSAKKETKAKPKSTANVKTKAKEATKAKSTPARGNGVRPQAKKTATKSAKTTAKKAAKTVTEQAVAEPPRNDGAPPPPAASGSHIWGAEAQANSTAKQAQSEESRGTRKAQKLNHQSAEAHQGHVGSRGRRNQARRDSR